MNQENFFKLRAAIGPDPKMRQAAAAASPLVGLGRFQGELVSNEAIETDAPMSEIERECTRLHEAILALETEFVFLKTKLAPVVINVPENMQGQSEPVNPAPGSDLGAFLRERTQHLNMLKSQIMSLEGRLAL